MQMAIWICTSRVMRTLLELFPHPSVNQAASEFTAIRIHIRPSQTCCLKTWGMGILRIAQRLQESPLTANMEWESSQQIWIETARWKSSWPTMAIGTCCSDKQPRGFMKRSH